jgi:O-antigen ligase
MTGLEAPHNYFLRMTLELGAVGIALLITLLARTTTLIMHRLPTVPREQGLLLRALLGIVVAIIACGIFNNPLLDAVGYYFWFMVGWVPALSMRRSRKTDAADGSSRG